MVLPLLVVRSMTTVLTPKVELELISLTYGIVPVLSKDVDVLDVVVRKNLSVKT